jgi:hypothetical protein
MCKEVALLWGGFFCILDTSQPDAWLIDTGIFVPDLFTL